MVYPFGKINNGTIACKPFERLPTGIHVFYKDFATTWLIHFLYIHSHKNFAST